MDKKWTESQEKAINSKGSTLVSASAGTGKTAVLTQKVTNTIVNENIDIDKILVMTFSNAAAEEMKERIRARLRELGADKTIKNSTRNRIYHSLRSFYSAGIETIHAFCNDVVKTYFYKVGLDPKVSIADTLDANILKLAAVREVLNAEYEEENPDFVMFEEYIDGTDTIENVIISAHEKMMTFIEPWKWLEDAVAQYDIANGEIPSYVRDMILSDFGYAEKMYDEAVSLLESFGDPKMEKNTTILKTDLSVIRYVIEQVKAGNGDILANPAILNDFGATVRFPSKTTAYDRIKELRTAGREKIIKNYKNFFMEEQLDRIRDMYGMACKFMAVIKKYDEIYTQKKKEENVIDFNDMERYAYEILKDDSISANFRNQYERVFVDEYQDTSPIQEAIITRISRKNNQFFVGDLKQSIYGFRASEPTLFKNRSEMYKKDKKSGTVIALTDNFRSSKNILDCANDVFTSITKQSRDLDYSASEMLVHGRKDSNDCEPVVVDILSDNMKDMFPGSTNDEIEAYNIARIIKNRVGKPIYDSETDEYRNAEYKDIVVSCRKLTGLTDTISQVFEANNIPFFIENAGSLLDTVEIQVLMNLINLVNSEKNDIGMISVIHAGLFGFTDDDLIALRTTDRDGSICENAAKAAESGTETGEKCRRMFSFLESVKAKEPVMPLTNILDYIIRETDFFDIFAVRKNGKQKIANIKLFQKIAFDFEEKSNEKLYGFMNYLGRVMETETPIDEAKVNYTENCVRVTTIHKSKGLEYPVEIMAFMGKAFSTIDKRSNIIIDKDAGLGFRYFDNMGDYKKKGKSLLRTSIEKAVTRKNFEEEMRLLYVAMTRAQENLYIQAMVPSGGFNNILEPNSMIDWILSTLSETGDSEEMFTSEAKAVSVSMGGDWKVNFIEPEELMNYTIIESERISDDTFKNEFSAPFIREGEEDGWTWKSMVPVSIPSSKLGSYGSTENTEGEFSLPGFLSGTEGNTAEIGTATHNFMKYLDFTQELDVVNLMDQKEKMVEDGIMTEDDFNGISLEKIAEFFGTEIGSQIKTADSHMKEKTMNIIKPANTIGIAETSEDVLVRCIADLIYEKDGEYFLVDYKTDRIKDAKNTAEIAARIQSHKAQISLYVEAFEKTYKKNISKAYLAFLDISDAVEVVF